MAYRAGLPSNLYSGDAVVLDNNRYTQYYLQKAAQRQAKDEALNQYYNKLHENINPAGMRLQDIEGGFNKDVDDWRKHYIENSDKIKNPSLDNGRAYNEHFSRYQGLLNKTNESKLAASQEQEIAKQKLAGKFDPTDDDLPVLHGIGASIYSPEHYIDPESKVQPYGLEHLSPNVPEFDAKQQASFIKGATNGFPIKPSYDYANTVLDKKAGKQYTPMYHQYEQQDLQAIGNQAADLYDGSKVARKHFQLAMHDPTEHDELNGAFKKVYGRDAENAKELAQGWVLSHANKRTDLGQKESKYVNPDIYYQHLGAREASSKRLKLYAKSLGAKADEIDDNDPMEAAVSQIEKNAVVGNKPLNPVGKEPINAQTIPLTEPLKKIFSRQDGVHIIQPNEIRRTDNGDFVGLFYQMENGSPKESNGKTLLRTDIQPIVLPRDQLKTALAGQVLTKKSQEKRLNNLNTAPKSTKTVKVKKGELDDL